MNNNNAFQFLQTIIHKNMTYNGSTYDTIIEPYYLFRVEARHWSPLSELPLFELSNEQ
jgi:hypothetical protein